MRESIRQLRYLLTQREQRNLLVLFAAMLGGAVLEMGAVGAIPGFVALLTSPDRVRSHALGRAILDLLPSRPDQMMLAAAAALLVIYIVKNSYVATVTYLQARYALNRQVSISRRLFAAYLHSPYTYHLQRNTADLLQRTNADAQNIVACFLFPALVMTMECLTATGILLLLLLAEPIISLVALLVLGGATLVFIRIVRARLVHYGLALQHYSAKMIQTINEGLGSLKVTKVFGREAHFLRLFTDYAEQFAEAGKFRQVMNELPRLFLEVCAMVGLLAVAALLLLEHRQVNTIVPTLSLLAVAVVRMIPSFNRITSSLTAIRYGTPSLAAVYGDIAAIDESDEGALDTVTTTAGTPFTTSIQLDGVRYDYPGAPRPSLLNISLEVPKGSVVGFVGSTGAGKTTLVDVVLGLLHPTQGRVLVDGRDLGDHLGWWRRQVGYVPQDIYLVDDSIRRNVAFGIPDAEIDDVAVRRAIEAAQLSDFIDSLPNGIDTVVGERGVRLSGGQRQRIGIARALYHDPSVLILDEATSSLDTETERYVMQAVDHLRGSRTIMMIAHRMTTVRNCDRLYLLRNGCVAGCGSWDELHRESRDFRRLLGVGA